MLDSAALLDPLSPTLFTGYRPSDSEDHPEIYQSIAHWIESEKFRGTDEGLREAVIHSPTPKEAVKLARRHPDAVRSNWKLIEGRVARAGLMMAAAQNAAVEDRLAAFAGVTSLEVGAFFQDGGMAGPYARSFLAGAMWEAADALYNRSHRVLIAAGVKGQPDSKQSAIDKHVDKRTTTELILPIAKATTLVAEGFAMRHYLPIRFSHAPNGRMAEEFLLSMLYLASAVLVIEAKGGKVFDKLIVLAKQLGKPVKIALV